VRIALGVDGVSVWSSEIFGGGSQLQVRAFLARTFAVEEVEDVELRRTQSYGRIRYAAVSDPARIWNKLGQVFRSADDVLAAPDARKIDADSVYLEDRGEQPLRVARIGNVLSSWRLRDQTEIALSLSHPILRNRRDVAFRLEEELAAILGVQDFRVNTLTARVSIRFDRRKTNVDRLARALEKAWPRLLEGLEGPPSRKRLVAALGLTGLAYTGQYLLPAWKPIAVAGVTLYSAPNVVQAAKQLARGEVGLPVMYTTALTFMLVSGLPFTAALMAGFMQVWPHLARRKMVLSQRRLLARPLRLPGWATRLGPDGVEREVDVQELSPNDIVVVRRGETIPVDGVVEGPAATLWPAAPFGDPQIEERVRGDSVAAGGVVRDGTLNIRVERAGAQTSARQVAALLPHGTIGGLPSSFEAERIANRNAKAALSLSALTLLLTRTMLPAQAILRPDYATAPRLSAQLSALQGIAEGLQRGVLFRNPAALDRLAAIDLCVIDSSAGLGRQRIRVDSVETVRAVTPDQVVRYALAAMGGSRSDRGAALAAFAARNRPSIVPDARPIVRPAAVRNYRNALGNAVEIFSGARLTASKAEVPKRFPTVLARRGRGTRSAGAELANLESDLRPLWVARDGKVIGVISFARSGAIVGREVVAALASHQPRAPIVYMSREGDPGAAAVARGLGIELSRGGPSGVVGQGAARHSGRVLWIGDGSAPDARHALATCAVSVSVAPLSRVGEDLADVQLPRRGLSDLTELLEIGRAHAVRLENDYRAIYSANLLGVGGAFVAGFGTLQVGLLSNVGAALVYVRRAWALDRLASPNVYS
jgi:cation transport ATPase